MTTSFKVGDKVIIKQTNATGVIKEIRGYIIKKMGGPTFYVTLYHNNETFVYSDSELSPLEKVATTSFKVGDKVAYISSNKTGVIVQSIADGHPYPNDGSVFVKIYDAYEDVYHYSAAEAHDYIVHMPKDVNIPNDDHMIEYDMPIINTKPPIAWLVTRTTTEVTLVKPAKADDTIITPLYQ